MLLVAVASILSLWACYNASVSKALWDKLISRIMNTSEVGAKIYVKCSYWNALGVSFVLLCDQINALCVFCFASLVHSMLDKCNVQRQDSSNDLNNLFTCVQKFKNQRSLKKQCENLSSSESDESSDDSEPVDELLQRLKRKQTSTRQQIVSPNSTALASAAAVDACAANSAVSASKAPDSPTACGSSTSPSAPDTSPPVPDTAIGNDTSDTSDSSDTHETNDTRNSDDTDTQCCGEQTEECACNTLSGNNADQADDCANACEDARDASAPAASMEQKKNVRHRGLRPRRVRRMS